MDKKFFKGGWTSRYLLAIGITTLLFITIYITSYYIIETEKSSAFLINSSGKQRMITKEIALESVLLIHSQDPSQRERSREAILSAASQMRKAHSGLLAADSPAVHSMYFNQPLLLDEKVRQYVQEAEALANLPDNELALRGSPRLETILKAASGNLLEALDGVANQFQRESDAKILQLQNTERWFLFAALIVLFLQVVYIFRPMIRTIEKERSELIFLNQDLERLSFMDGLTGVANRRFFDDFLQRECARAAREHTPLALIMIDIDFFKAYNDAFGHQSGDECLQKVASALKHTLKRPADLVARYGGEEFAAVLPNTDLEAAQKVAEALRADVIALQLPHANTSVSPFVSISLGIAGSAPGKSRNTADLIRAADQALYEAKRAGRNQSSIVL